MSPAVTRRFRIVIADTLFYELDIDAPNVDAAEDIAWDIFASDERPDAPRGSCEIIECSEVRS